MRKGQFIVMKCDFTTYCGKAYQKGHVGLLKEDVTIQSRNDCVEVQFPIHGGYGTSSIKLKDIELAEDQTRASKKYNLGKEKEKCMMY
jgi:hypothetical protein